MRCLNDRYIKWAQKCAVLNDRYVKFIVLRFAVLSGGSGSNTTSRKFRGLVDYTVLNYQIVFGARDFIWTRQGKLIVGER